jgi:hypothetical protein
MASSDYPKIEGFEKEFICIGCFFFLEQSSLTLTLLNLHDHTVSYIHLGNRFKLRKIVSESRGYRKAGITTGLKSIRCLVFENDTMYTPRFSMKMIKGFFMPDKHIDRDAAGDADRQPGYVNKGSQFVSCQVSKNGNKVISDHTKGLCCYFIVLIEPSYQFGCLLSKILILKRLVICVKKTMFGFDTTDVRKRRSGEW